MMKDIEGFEGIYGITTDGKVWNYRRKKWILGSPSKKGYIYFHLRNKKIDVKKLGHRLVAQAFIKNKQNHKTVNHKNFDKTDNTKSNLEWCSFADNLKHRDAGKRLPVGVNHHNSVLNNDKVYDIRYLYTENKLSMIKIARLFSVSPSTVRSIVRREAWKHI